SSHECVVSHRMLAIAPAAPLMILTPASERRSCAAASVIPSAVVSSSNQSCPMGQREGRGLSTIRSIADYPIPLVVGMLLATREKLSVLDFGGGMGLQYLEVIAKVPVAKERLDYYIMDGNASIQNRPDELNQFNKLKFISNIEDLKEPIDIIHIGSTLQYVNDWKFLIFDLKTKYQPMYFVFSDLLAGDVPTFVSHQIFYEKRIPVHMLNIDEFISFMKSLGFDNSYQSLFQSNILGRETLSNFELPENKRIRKTINIIFRNNIAIHDEIRS
ncbi:MAG: methyltransferase, TIGR04325 family, partial [Ignavibacteria bacterium]|nr:methyltransferase, TIGR04325 family [Ignavibacteria bacterium]